MQLFKPTPWDMRCDQLDVDTDTNNRAIKPMPWEGVGYVFPTTLEQARLESEYESKHG